jgi:formylglycine-generating enzyme required for sulfatase activity
MKIHGGLLWLSVVTIALGCTSTQATREAGHVYRDCGDCPELVVVVAGAAAPAGIPDAIAVGRYEVTRDEFAAFEKDDPVPAPSCFFAFETTSIEYFDRWTRQTPGLGAYRPSGRDPATCVSWIEAQRYVEWLSRKTGQSYRLPSEREWQFFESGDAKTRYAWGTRSSDACRYANGLDRTAAAQDWATHPQTDLVEVLPTKSGVLDCDDGAAYTAPVGSYRPNAFGLYDTIGNVWEWTADCVTDQKQWPEGALYPPCIARGGSWQTSPDALTNQAQQKFLSATHREHLGFRVIRLLSE